MPLRLSKSSLPVSMLRRSSLHSAYCIGSLISAVPSCAMTAPSRNCTMEWMMLPGWTTTCMRSAGTSKSHDASMTSSPLFTMVAESMVIFLPMLQLGCLSASSTVTCSSISLVYPKNGPPDAVSNIFSVSP